MVAVKANVCIRAMCIRRITSIPAIGTTTQPDLAQDRKRRWKDDWTKYGIDEKGNKVEISDTQRYKMCGNGVVSNVIKEITGKILLTTKSHPKTEAKA